MILYRTLEIIFSFQVYDDHLKTLLNFLSETYHRPVVGSRSCSHWLWTPTGTSRFRRIFRRIPLYSPANTNILLTSLYKSPRYHKKVIKSQILTLVEVERLYLS